MRRFSSYGPINTKLHYYAPREALIEWAHTQLVGADPDEGGHYITVWAPRQTGKTWLMQQILFRLQREEQSQEFDTVKINLQHLRAETDLSQIVGSLASKLGQTLGRKLPECHTLPQFEHLFSSQVLHKPLILILDEFDALSEEAISGLAAAFRNIYVNRQDQEHLPTADKAYLLHGLALIGVRSVLGIENVSGSPFNVQRSMHVPNLTFEEVEGMFADYQQESGQIVEPAVVERLFYEVQGQPGLIGWFGELLTETYNKHNPTITVHDFEVVYAAALKILPNNNILNIISKAKQEPYRQTVLELYKVSEEVPFTYDDPHLSFLYMNGVIDWEQVNEVEYHIKFASPFVQRRLFNYFADSLFRDAGQLYPPFTDLSEVVTEDGLHLKPLLQLYEQYLQENRSWLLDDAPRRKDLRIFEAVYHFNLYMYLARFLDSFEGRVHPEFPTGNGQIDLLIRHGGRLYGLELKSFVNQAEYNRAIKQAARYGQQLGLAEMALAFFVESIDESNRQKYEVTLTEAETGVTVEIIFVEIGSRRV